MKRALSNFAVAAALHAVAVCSVAAPASLPAAPIESLPSLDIAGYMGTWYQVAWIPNRFQKQCAADTSARYRALGEGRIEVVNRCVRADGSVDEVSGVARPARQAIVTDGQLRPARLEVSFLPRWLRWTGIGWGDYWVVELAPDARYAIVSEPSREYLWVLARKPALSAEDSAMLTSRLRGLGFDPARVQAHPQRAR